MVTSFDISILDITYLQRWVAKLNRLEIEIGKGSIASRKVGISHPTYRIKLLIRGWFQ